MKPRAVARVFSSILPFSLLSLPFLALFRLFPSPVCHRDTETLRETRSTFVDLVKTCLRSLVSVYELLRELGGYLPPKSIAPADITPLVSRLLRVNGAPLFDFFVDVDLYDRSRSSVFLDLPTKHQEDAFFAENPVSLSYRVS